MFEAFATMIYDMIENKFSVQFPFSAYPSALLEWASRYTNQVSFKLFQAAVEKVYKNFRERNIDFSSLAKMVAAKVCTDLEVEVYDYDPLRSTQKEISSPRASKNMLGLAENQIILRLNQPIALRETYDYALLSWNADSGESVGADFREVPQPM